MIEAQSRSKAGKAKWVNRGEEGRKQVVLDELKSRILDSNFKVKNLKSERKSITNIFKKQTSHNIFRRKLSKILEFSKFKRDTARAKHDEKVKRLKMKHGRIKDEFVVPDEISEFSECRMFQSNPDVKPEEPSGPVIVCDEGEELELSSEEWNVLARGPKYCVVRGCSEEDMRVEIETSILKHKWDCMGCEGEEEEENQSEEERKESDRVAQLAEEMAAQTRMVYDSEKNTWDARGLRVTDYKHNSRVIFPKAQAGDKENNLEVMRAELLHHHRAWVKENCNCKGDQKSNLSKEEQMGLKSLKKRVADGNLVVLPTDKSGSVRHHVHGHLYQGWDGPHQE